MVRREAFNDSTMSSQSSRRVGVEGDGARLVRLGIGLDQSTGDVGDAGANRQRARVEVDVLPPQTAQLTASGAKHGGETHIETELFRHARRHLEETTGLIGRRRVDDWFASPRWSGRGGGVRWQPSPSVGLAERAAQYRVDL